MVHRNIEEPLNLAGVKVHRQDPRGSCRRDKICNQFGRNGCPREHFPVLPGIAIIRKDGCDPFRRCPFQGIDQDQKLHQIVIDRRTDRLDHENIHSPDALMDLDIDFTVTECLDHRFPNGSPKMLRNLLNEFGIRISGEDPQSIKSVPVPDPAFFFVIKLPFFGLKR